MTNTTKPHTLLHLLLITLTTTTYLPNYAIQAKHITHAFQQQNGDTLLIKNIGNHKNHATITQDGWKIQLRNDNYFYISRNKKTNKPSKILAKNENKRSQKEQKWLNKHGINIYLNHKLIQNP